MEASKTRRFFNWLIDNIGVLLLISALIRWGSPSTTTQLQLRLTSVGFLFVYYLATEYFFQRSLGKFLTHTLVVNRQDERPSLAAVFLRTLCRFIPLEPASLLLNKKRTWHDMLSGTKVVFINY
ncbi:RDD family protein [Hymenobacter sublimis]|uniref:RDD family protein n=1 Tax=Hymenobacter sublimis TaxID=2933777 RepID=A0ABY4J608_9BACT|nr:RDD family protein [Hymenobacter sublimis]UPL48263.1 RDD family protein [Hymenobacter sublimis]